MSKRTGRILLVSLFALIFSVSFVSAQTEGIPLQKDVFLGAPIYGPEDLPEEITFALYDAQNGLTPLGSQTFSRGQYTVDFEFSQSDGVTGGSVARVKADFTQTLNLKDASGQTLKPKEIWAALKVAGAEVGSRTKVSDETLVQLLLNSDASLATYLTLVYEGDDNPLTTIYKTLPISSLSSDGSTTSLSNYFRAVAGASSGQPGVDTGDTTGGYFRASAGFQSSPSFSFVGDTGTGMYASTLNNLRFSTGGTLRMSINEWGNVGIKTTAPGATMEINSGAADVAPTLGLTTPGGADFFSFFGGKLSNQKPYFAWRRGPLRFGTATTIGGAGWTELMRVESDGKVGIGTKTPIYELCVKGTIRCETLIVDTGWSDFVFEDSYKLPQLNEVEQFIKENKHLPGIPTEAEVKEKGVSVGNISSKLLQKIEELTLYVIDINKENESLKAQLANLEAQLKEIKN